MNPDHRLEALSGEELIRLEGADLGYEKKPVLTGVDLVIRRGDFVGLVGPNGSGKTTLLRGIIGLLQPLRGRILVGPGGARNRIALGYVPQVQTLDPVYPLTVSEVVLLGAFNRLGWRMRPTGADRDFLRRCLAEVEMEGDARRLFGVLSAGQKQRVLLARALFTRPDVLLLDEPTSGADHAVEKKIMKRLREWHRSGHTIVLVCHELDAVRQTVEEILWVSRGRMVRDAPDALLSEHLVREMYESGPSET